MFKKTAILYIYTETPLHAGSGISLGVVDLPIQRERHTYYPLVQASGVKGNLRDEAFTIRKDQLLNEGKTKEEAERLAKEEIEWVFGPEEEAWKHAGALSPGDARLLLFPMRSLMGVFAWTTSKFVLERFKRDLGVVGIKADWKAVGPENEREALVTEPSEVVAGENVVLEEFSFIARPDGEVTNIANWLADNAFPQGEEYAPWRQRIKGGLVILPEDAFRDFTTFSTQVEARIRIKPETKTVVPGGLWSEEHLPSDTLLYVPIFASAPRFYPPRKGEEEAKPPERLRTAEDVMNFIEKLELDRTRLGGDETVGRGMVKLRFVKGG
jgi:CRISPR-associated protein Cmr4